MTLGGPWRKLSDFDFLRVLSLTFLKNQSSLEFSIGNGKSSPVKLLEYQCIFLS